MKETVISWTITNWITVFLMVFIGSLFIGLVLRAYASMRGRKVAEE